MVAIRIQHLALGIALAVTSAGCSSWRPPVVVKVARTINNAETISSKDYERLREVTEEAIDHIKGVDPHIRPQLTLSSQKNFVDEIADQTRSGFGPDLLITDSDKALELYRRKLVDPMEWPPSKEETHRLGSPTNQLQAEADSDPANDSAGETP